jgi:hypothetical protein
MSKDPGLAGLLDLHGSIIDQEGGFDVDRVLVEVKKR